MRRGQVVSVAGMHCDGCARALSLALTRLDGVLDAKADLAAGQVRVRFDEGRVRFDEGVVSGEQVFERIEATGFEVAASGAGGVLGEEGP